MREFRDFLPAIYKRENALVSDVMTRCDGVPESTEYAKAYRNPPQIGVQTRFALLQSTRIYHN